MWYSEITLIYALWAHWPKIAHLSKILLSHIFPLDRNDTSNLEPKTNPSKTIPTLEMLLELGRPFMTYVVARSRQIVRMKKRKKHNKRKIDCRVMHLKKIRSSLSENQESQKNVLRKQWKNYINTNHFSPARNRSSV